MRKINTGLLAATLVVVGLLGLGGYFLRGFRQDQLATYLKDRSEQLAGDEDWGKAYTYQQRYLLFRPSDYDARLRLVEIAKERTASRGERESFIRLLYQTVGMAGESAVEDKTRMRAWLAEQLLATGDTSAALKTAEEVLAADNDEYKSLALRVAALSRHAAVPKRGSATEAARRKQYAEMMPLLIEAIEANPTDVTLSVLAAALYRELPLLAEGDEQGPTALADEIMDTLVERSAGDPDALVARFKYRKLHRLADAREDLKNALAVDPNHYEANLRSGIEANLSGEEDSADRAEAFYRKAIEIEPEADAPYLLLAQLLRVNQDRSGALEVLEDAAKSLPATALAIRFEQADFLLADGQIEEASPLIKKLRKQFESQIARVPVRQRSRWMNRLRLIEARLSQAEGDSVEALLAYRAVASSPEGGVDRTLGGVARQGNLGAAQLFLRFEQWDQAAEELAQLADRLEAEIDSDSNNSGLQYEMLGAAEAVRGEYLRARIQAAEAYLRSGQPVQGRKQLETLAQAGKLPSEALEASLLIELAIQLDSVPSKRRWEEFKFLLAKSKEALPQSDRVYFAELRFLQETDLAQEQEASTITQLLDEGAERFPDSGAYWRLAAQTRLMLQDNEAAEAALQSYMKLEDDLVQQAESWIGFLAEADRIHEANEWLSDKLEDASGEQRQRLELLSVKLQIRAGEPEQALQQALTGADAAPSKESVLLALELSISQKDWQSAERMENKLAEHRLVPPVDRRFYRAIRLVSNYESLSVAEKSELSKLVAAIRTERPLWHRGAALSAQLAEASGDVGQAIEAYELAFALGDRRPRTLERLTLHLYQAGLYDRAQRVIDRLYARGDEVSLGAESLAISTALKRERLSEAISLAKQSVEDHPNDPARRLWLYNVLWVDGQRKDANQVLTKAREDFADNALIWNALFSHRLRSQQQGEAEQLLDQLPTSIASDKFKQNVALAQGYELLGKADEAKLNYQAAIRLKPADTSIRLRYASLLLKSDTQAAQSEFEAVLDQDPTNAAARRKLAALLASSGANSDWERIDELLLQAESTNDVLDRRLRAVLLTRRGRSIEERASNCELARRILVSIVEDSEKSPEDIDRFLLAGAYEQEGILKRDPIFFGSARNQLRKLVDQPDSGEKYDGHYIAFLLRSLDALTDLEGADRIREAFASDAERRLIEAGASVENQSVLHRQAALALRARLLRAQGRVDEALALLKTFAEEHVETEEDKAVQARLILGLGSLYTLLDSHELAEPWYRRLAEMAPGARMLLSKSLIEQGKSADAINLFLDGASSEANPKDAAVLASVLAASDSSSGDFNQAWPAISGALEQHGDNVQLLMSVAVLHVTQGKEEEAIRLFRRIIDLAPKHMMALNNLATLLGERESDRAEALRVIGQAIETAGRKPALLDTQGTIQLRLGDTAAAIASLEEAVVAVNVDPRYYFHLAAAYSQGGNLAQASKALAEAKRRGIDDAVLTTADRQLMEELKASLESANTVAKKAA